MNMNMPVVEALKGLSVMSCWLTFCPLALSSILPRHVTTGGAIFSTSHLLFLAISYPLAVLANTAPVFRSDQNETLLIYICV